MYIDLRIAVRSIMIDCAFTEKDIGYVLRRLASEGHIFLTVTLPKYGKAVLRSLETGIFERAFLSISGTSDVPFKFKNSLIHLGYDLLSQVFDPMTGLLLKDPCPLAVKKIRQVSEYFYKLCLPFTNEQNEEVVGTFVANENVLKELGENPEVARFSEQLRKDFETHWKDLAIPQVHEILAVHRPRSTTGTFVSSDEDYFFVRESEAVVGCIGSANAYKGYYKPYPSVKLSELPSFSSIIDGDYSELLLVPKDSRGPRTICREAMKRLETQMSYFDFMCLGLTRISQGAINFKDQTVNRRIAEKSSVSRDYATLDLKDASDMVSYAVIKTVFRNSPGLRWFITGDRRASFVDLSRASKLYASQGKRRLMKLAGMGSGLTFPTMSLLISLAICNKVVKRFGLLYEDVRKDVFVYGDDICVPRKWYATAISSLALIGLKVNTEKSFASGFFRESCGADFYCGVDVGIVRLKLSNSKPTILLGGIELPDSPAALLQLYCHIKELHKEGLTQTAKYYMSLLKRAHIRIFNKGMIPGTFDDDSDLIVDFFSGTDHHRLDDNLEVLTIVPSKRKYGRPILSEKGYLIKRSAHRYLGTYLKATSDQSDRASRLEKSNTAHLDVGAPRSFEDITVPRTHEFRFKKVRAEYITDYIPKSRDAYLIDRTRTVFMENLGRLLVCQVFMKAFM